MLWKEAGEAALIVAGLSAFLIRRCVDTQARGASLKASLTNDNDMSSGKA